MPQVNRNDNPQGPGEGRTIERGGIFDTRPLSPDEELKEQRRQAEHLGLLRSLFYVAVVLLLVTGYILYGGHEAPPWSMRFNQPTDSTGYNPPPNEKFLTLGNVPRSGLPRALPDTPNGAIPAVARGLTNPVANTPNVVKWGAQVYAENCAFCHGVQGIGDGPAGESYIPHPPDLTSTRVQSYPPGVIYYQITNGILSTPTPETQKYLPREWHAFRGTIDERDRWACVAFVKSLGSGTPLPTVIPTGQEAPLVPPGHGTPQAAVTPPTPPAPGQPTLPPGVRGIQPAQNPQGTPPPPNPLETMPPEGQTY